MGDQVQARRPRSGSQTLNVPGPVKQQCFSLHTGKQTLVVHLESFTYTQPIIFYRAQE